MEDFPITLDKPSIHPLSTKMTGPPLGRSWKVSAAVVITVTMGYMGVCLDLIIYTYTECRK